ncbi:Uncharacterised protein [Escherichia coli]|nr:Uncharacterised protein [Escherichia coli]
MRGTCRRMVHRTDILMPVGKKIPSGFSGHSTASFRCISSGVIYHLRKRLQCRNNIPYNTSQITSHPGRFYY